MKHMCVLDSSMNDVEDLSMNNVEDLTALTAAIFRVQFSSPLTGKDPAYSEPQRIWPTASAPPLGTLNV